MRPPAPPPALPCSLPYWGGIGRITPTWRKVKAYFEYTLANVAFRLSEGAVQVGGAGGNGWRQLRVPRCVCIPAQRSAAARPHTAFLPPLLSRSWRQKALRS